MSAPEEEFYTEERWENWLDRLREEDLDLEDEDTIRLRDNLQDDVAIAVAKIVTAYEDDEIEEEEALEELEDIHDVVMAEPDLASEDAVMLVDGVQTSLMAVLHAAQQFVVEGVADEAEAEEYIMEAARAEEEEEFDRALGLVACAGTQIIGGRELDVDLAEELDYGFVMDWMGGLYSLQSALKTPEVVEEEEEGD